MYPIPCLRSVVVKLLPVDALLMSSDSFLHVGWAVVCPVFEALASMSCPWVGLALDALHLPVLLLLDEVTEVLAVVVVAQDYPTGRSSHLLCPLAALVLAVEKRQTGRAQAAAPLGRVEAIAETVFLSPCSTREEL
jgi:hypothetical protein